MKWNARTRALIACCGLAACFTVYSFRLVDLQVTRRGEFATVAAQKHVLRQELPARRGLITDIHGEILAENESVKSVVADGALIPDPKALASVLAKPLGLDPKELAEKLTTNRRYVVIKRGVPEPVTTPLWNDLRNAKLKGIFFEQDASRLYPNGPMLSHVLGFTDHTHSGVQGIEKTQEKYLRGRNGWRFIEHDRTGQEIVPYRGLENRPIDGSHVRLTIDMGLQNIVENELDIAMRTLKPKSATVILMRPQTGEILAMSNRPNFDANAISDDKQAMKNRAVIDMLEPGSTFKIATVAAALNERIVNPETQIFCENGRFMYAGIPLRDHHPYGMMSVHDGIVKSSNVLAAKLALQLGDLRFYEYLRRFGFGDRTGIELPGEIPGIIHPPHRWSKISITRMPMGHEVGVTALQMVSAMSVIANGGKLMMPQIVSRVTNDEGAVIADYPPVEVRRVVTEAVTDKVRAMLVEVVSKRGTAALAAVPGYQVAGKTGTAQKLDPKTHTYVHDKYVVSFLGFMPAENPEFVGIVMIDDATTKAGLNYGGLVAAPIFSRIAERAARYLNLPPSPDLMVAKAGSSTRPERD